MTDATRAQSIAHRLSKQLTYEGTGSNICHWVGSTVDQRNLLTSD